MATLLHLTDQSRALPLTAKQERVWSYLRSCKRSPTYREILAALGTKNMGDLNRVVVSLRERGFVSYIPGRARTLVAIDPREDLSSFPTEALVAEIERRSA